MTQPDVFSASANSSRANLGVTPRSPTVCCPGLGYSPRSDTSRARWPSSCHRPPDHGRADCGEAGTRLPMARSYLRPVVACTPSGAGPSARSRRQRSHLNPTLDLDHRVVILLLGIGWLGPLTRNPTAAPMTRPCGARNDATRPEPTSFGPAAIQMSLTRRPMGNRGRLPRRPRHAGLGLTVTELPIGRPRESAMSSVTTG